MKTPPVRDGTWLWLAEWAREAQDKVARECAASQTANPIETALMRGRWAVYEEILRMDRHLQAVAEANE